MAEKTVRDLILQQAALAERTARSPEANPPWRAVLLELEESLRFQAEALLASQQALELVARGQGGSHAAAVCADAALLCLARVMELEVAA